MNIRAIGFAAVLALCTASARAGSVTYDFVETGAGGVGTPGLIGAILTFASPPASPDSTWTTALSSDVLGFQFTDSAVAPVGSYAPFVVIVVGSDAGTTLDAGTISGQMGSNVVATQILFGDIGNSNIQYIGHGTPTPFYGDWVLAAASVPEPSSFVLAGTAALAGLGLWARRRRRSCATTGVDQLGRC